MGYRIGIAVLVAANLGYVGFKSGIFSVMVVIGPVVVLVLAVLAGFRFFEGRDVTLAERLERPAVRAFVIAATVVGVVAVIPWVAVLQGGWATRAALLIGALFATVGAFYASRQVGWHWAMISAPAILTACVWGAMFSLVVAYRIEWRGLEWKEPEDGLDGTGFAIAVSVITGTTIAFLAGLIIGMVSQAGKTEAATPG